MDPVERADAAVVRARRHVCGYSKVCETVPDTGVIRAEDDEVLRLDGRHV